MSRSETYRSALLSAEVRAQLGRASRSQRLAEVVPTLRAAVGEALRTSSLDHHRRLALQGRVAASATLEDLRAVAVDVARATARPRVGVRGDVGTLAAATVSRPVARPRADPAVAAAVGFDLAALSAERASMGRVAARLAVEEPALDDAGRALREAEVLLASGRADLAAAALDRARAALTAADERITDVLAAAECRARLLTGVNAALRSVGYRALPPIVDGDGTVVIAHAADGRQAVVDITGSGAAVTVASSFTDPGDAVAPTHPDAGSACDPADRDESAFASAIADTTGLDVVTDDQHTRSQRGVRGAGRQPRSRRRPDTTPRHWSVQ